MRQYKPFKFKQFSIVQNNAAMKVGTDGVLLGAWAQIKKNECILDVGTGTGLISLMLAQKADGSCRIDAIEIEKGAIEDAILNIKNSRWNESIKLHHIDFQLYKSKTLYDVIISNPPFFEGLAPENEIRSIARNATDKLSYENLILKATKLLKEDGRIYLILPYSSLNKVVKLGFENNLIVSKQLNIKPKKNKLFNRVLVELIRNHDESKTDLKIEEIIIRNDLNEYTSEHKQLTQAYYLNQ